MFGIQLFCDVYDKDGTYYVLMDLKGRYYRGAKLWRWTKYLSCAAQLDSPDMFEGFIIPKLLSQGQSVLLVQFTREGGEIRYPKVMVFLAKKRNVT